MARASAIVRLSPDGERAYRAPIDGHASDAAYVAWADAHSGRVHARRLAPGGILGTLRTLSDDSDAATPAVLGTGDGRAAVAWVRDGRLYASLYG